MDQKTLLILKKFDLRKLSKTCNVHNCNKSPSKEIVLFEHDVKTSRDKEIASLYFCSEHCRTNLRTFLKKLNTVCEKGKRINKKVLETGHTTH